MRARAGWIGSLAIALSASLFAQPIPESSIADKEMGWLKMHDFKGTSEPLKVDTRVYSGAQRTIAADLANWMQASYSPIGGLGDVVRTFPRLSAAAPQSYGVVGKIYTELKYGANGRIEPFTNSHNSWNVMVNGSFGRCQSGPPQWIVVSWTAQLNDPVVKRLHDAVLTQFNFEYSYNRFFDPEKVKGVPYAPLRPARAEKGPAELQAGPNDQMFVSNIRITKS